MDQSSPDQIFLEDGRSLADWAADLQTDLKANRLIDAAKRKVRKAAKEAK